MSGHEEADAVVANFNGRFFGGKRLTAELYDGVTRFKINETDAEREKRLEQVRTSGHMFMERVVNFLFLLQWEKFISEDDAAPKNGKNEKGDDDDDSLDLDDELEDGDPCAVTPPRVDS